MQRCLFLTYALYRMKIKNKTLKELSNVVGSKISPKSKTKAPTSKKLFVQQKISCVKKIREGKGLGFLCIQGRGIKRIPLCCPFLFVHLSFSHAFRWSTTNHSSLQFFTTHIGRSLYLEGIIFSQSRIPQLDKIVTFHCSFKDHLR